MAATTYTGSAEELHDILDAWDSHERLSAWRDAYAARLLAEAGAVHPQVHTPNRVQQWLSQHGWQALAPASPDLLAAEWMDSEARTVFVPLQTDTVDYARYARYALERAAQAADLSLSQVLAEVALLPGEWSW